MPVKPTALLSMFKTIRAPASSQEGSRADPSGRGVYTTPAQPGSGRRYGWSLSRNTDWNPVLSFLTWIRRDFMFTLVFTL